ncbi:hypothetical protein [Leptospira borgpetersenii]|nr:hypothetical protein [Leptospira borgpetersenii serovar Balcanica]
MNVLLTFFVVIRSANADELFCLLGPIYANRLVRLRAYYYTALVTF